MKADPDDYPSRRLISAWLKEPIDVALSDIHRHKDNPRVLEDALSEERRRSRPRKRLIRTLLDWRAEP